MKSKGLVSLVVILLLSIYCEKSFALSINEQWRGRRKIEELSQSQSLSLSQEMGGRRTFLWTSIDRLLIPAFIAALPQPSYALTPREAEKSYDTYAKSYDELDGGSASSALGIEQARIDLIQQATGNVLEICVGTGLNLDKYDLQKVSSLTLVDISDGMLQQTKERVKSLEKQDISVRFVKADATSELVKFFGEQAFDTVVDSFSLCVMGDKGAKNCLREIGRVVKKPDVGGSVLLLENSRSSNRLLGMYQDITADAAASVGGKGCVYNQDVSAMIRGSGILQIERETDYAAGLFRSFVCKRI